MKITAVETLELAEFPFLFWLRIHTDDGLIGLGETFYVPRAVSAVIHDVFATLQKNRAAEMNSGGDEIEIKKISSRRKKDYWLMLVGGNVVIVGGSFFVGGIALVFGLAGVIIYSLGLTWVMWQVMSKY